MHLNFLVLFGCRGLGLRWGFVDWGGLKYDLILLPPHAQCFIGGLSLKDYLKTQFFLTVNALEKPTFLLLLSLPRHIGNIFEWKLSLAVVRKGETSHCLDKGALQVQPNAGRGPGLPAALLGVSST